MEVIPLSPPPFLERKLAYQKPKLEFIQALGPDSWVCLFPAVHLWGK
jgi:hypothetical protein